MLTKNIILLILALCCLLPLHAAESATAVLDKAAAKIRASKSLSASYTITADGQSNSGTLTISVDRFTIVSPQISSWYDGRTQWTYSTHVGEVNITEPSPEELQQVNPFAIINSFKTHYRASMLKSAAGEKKIRLTATQAGSDIHSVDLTLNATTLYPTRIVLNMANRRSVSITVSSVKPGEALPVSFFRYDAAKHPGLPVVDLR